MPMLIPCGKCVACLQARARQWAIRCVHESKSHTENCFITLTYDGARLPDNGSLVVRHVQLFLKRLRKKNKEKKIKYFHCGEYGRKFHRPHYHVLLFGHAFKDQIFWKKINDNNLYISKELSDAWQLGFASIGALTAASAAYVARYVLKKKFGEIAVEHYTKIDKSTGEVLERKPEYITMSRRPGIGSAFLEKFKHEIYPDDFIIIDGKKLKPPRYYDKKFEAEHKEVYEDVRASRLKKHIMFQDDQTWERRQVRDKVARAKQKQYKRSYEEA